MTTPKLRTPRTDGSKVGGAGSNKRASRSAWAVVGLLLLAVVAVIVWKGVSGSPTDSQSGTKKLTSAPQHAAPLTAIQQTADVPAATLDKIGAPKTVGYPVGLLHQQPLSIGGKPAIFFAGADYCSYCGVERWALVQALSRFGSFSGLRQTESAPDEDHPYIWSYSFHGSSYSSKYVALSAVEIYNNVPLAGLKNGYQPLDKPSVEQQALINRYDTPPYGEDDGLPFIDIGNRFFVKHSQFDPSLLKGLKLPQIAAKLASPSDRVAQAIDASANVLTAAICVTTHDQPAATCNAAAVTKAENLFASRPSGR